MFFKIAFLKYFEALSRKYLRWSPFLIKLHGWRPLKVLDVQNRYFSYFLCHCFVFLYNSIRISILWLFRTTFHSKIFTKCNFPTHDNIGSSNILIKLLKFRKNSRITVTSLSNLLRKHTLSLFYFRRGLKGLPKNNPTEKKRSRNSSHFEACARVKTHKRENAKFIVTNFKDRFKS